MNVAEPIRYRARVYGASTAVIRADGSVVSYLALDRIIDGFAAALVEAGVAAGETVGLDIGWPDEFPGVVAHFALARLGAASADLGLPAAHMEWCIAEGERKERDVPALQLPILWARARILQGTPIPERREGDAVYRIFGSSGTTGSPKFIAVTHACMAARVRSYIVTVGGAAVARVCAVGYGNSVGYSATLRTFWTGGILVQSNPEQLLELINRHRVGSLVIAPSSLAKLVAGMPANLPMPSALGAIECAGSVLPSPLRAVVERRLCRHIVTNYGTGETGPIAFGLAGQSPSSVGFVAPGVEVEVVDEAGQACPPGADGILRVRSALAGSGYVGDEEGTARVFRNGWVYTSDVGALDVDGSLRLSGRVSDIINMGGNKVRPGEIEDVLLALPGVSDAAAFGVPDGFGVEEPWAALVSEQPIPEAVLSAATRALGPRAPRQVLFVTALPRNANGKVLRDELTRAAIAYRAGQARDAG